MAAPGAENTRLCDKCFATVEVAAPFCPECGAPMASSEGSDNEIYPLLARANLLRMRAQYKQAEDLCLKILRRYPSNATTNTLLGDICAERGDLEQASQWYELALEIVPESKVEREKLAAIRRRIHERETARTAEQIGLPVRRRNMVWPVVAAIAAIVAVGVGAYFWGSKTMEKRQRAAMVDVGAGGVLDTGPEKQAGTGYESTPGGAFDWSSPKLTTLIGEKLPDVKGMLGAWQHPGSGVVYVAVASAQQDDLRILAARLGAAALEAVPESPQAVVRILKDGQDVLVADVTRSDYNTFLASAEDPWKTPDGQYKLLTNVWPAPPPGPGSTSVEQGADQAGGDQGSAVKTSAGEGSP